MKAKYKLFLVKKHDEFEIYIDIQFLSDHENEVSSNSNEESQNGSLSVAGINNINFGILETFFLESIISSILHDVSRKDGKNPDKAEGSQSSQMQLKLLFIFFLPRLAIR